MILINLFISFESIVCSFLSSPFESIMTPLTQIVDSLNVFKNLETTSERNRYFLATEDDIIVFNCELYDNNELINEKIFIYLSSLLVYELKMMRNILSEQQLNFSE